METLDSLPERPTIDPAKIQGIWGPRWRNLFVSVDGSTLALFRIFFGLVLLVEVVRYFQHDWIGEYWIEPRYHFGYWPLDFLKPLPGDGMYFLFAILGLLAVMIAVGLFYRLSCALFWLLFTYSFLLEQARYLNHFYLVSLVSLVLVFVPAHQEFSLDRLIFKRLRSSKVPAWSLWLVRFMVGIPYFFGGVAKLNGDWLRGEPLREWILGKTEVPVIGPLLDYDATIMVMAYVGLALDLLIVPALLFRQTRWVGFICITAFHLVNSQIFTIGIFPWFMIAATMIYFAPDWPKRFWRKIRGQSKDAGFPNVVTPKALTGRQKMILVALVVWVLGQVLIPLRHFLIPGNVHWTEEGHRYAWHMKLRSKDASGSFWVVDRATKESEEVDPEDYLVDFQATSMITKPYLIWQFAQIVQQAYAARGKDVQVFADLFISLNGRKFQQFTNPSVDLTSVPRPWWPPTDWILPFQE